MDGCMDGWMDPSIHKWMDAWISLDATAWAGIKVKIYTFFRYLIFLDATKLQ